MTALTLPAGPFAAASLPELGLSRKTLRGLVAAGTVRRVLRGVYVAAHQPDTLDLRAAALHLVVADGHVIIDRTAAWLWGIDCHGFAELEVAPIVETCALRGRQPTSRAGADGHSRDLSADDITTVRGLRVTTPLRTALDLGCHLRRREAYAALCMFARQHDVTAAVLARQLGRFAKRRGVVQLRELAGLVDERVESVREAWTLLAIHDAGLPLPEPQVWVDCDGVPTYRLDFAYRKRRVCVEYDGAEAHDQSVEQREHDRVRRDWLRAKGWIVIVVRRGDFTDEALDRWLRELREALQPAYTTRRW